MTPTSDKKTEGVALNSRTKWIKKSFSYTYSYAYILGFKNLNGIHIVCKSIGIFNGCEVLIENSVKRVTVRHHVPCRVMPNSYSSDGIFNLHRRTIMDSFSWILFLRQLHLVLNRCCFINFTLK